MGRISSRFAKPHDAARFETNGVGSGPLPPGESGLVRIAAWRVEGDAGRPAAMRAEGGTGRLGTLQTRNHAPPQVLEALMHDAQLVAKRYRRKAVTLRLPLENNSAIEQAKSWGFTEFRFVPEGETMLAFFRKPLV